MQKLKQISSLLLISFLNLTGCQEPEIRNLRQRNIRIVVVTEESTGRRYIDEEQSGCFTRMYRHSKDYVGSVGQETSSDILECDDIIGYGVSDYVDLTNFLEDVRREIMEARN